MKNILIGILSFVSFLGNILKSNKTKRRVRFDRELHDSIKRGDGETVGRIREKWKRYKDL